MSYLSQHKSAPNSISRNNPLSLSPFQVKLFKTFVNNNYHLFLPSYLLLTPLFCRLSPPPFLKTNGLNIAKCSGGFTTSPYCFLHLSYWLDFLLVILLPPWSESRSCTDWFHSTCPPPGLLPILCILVSQRPTN